ncbi:transglycosylase SLT domain-containing protein [Pseudoalteromonas phenolica]|uniref:transglycosylase SLT domain-containing protein n=1 Tax=Pseudoalteromonas phenolica TaxID=161398 RepID=UPI0026C978F0
MKKIKKSFLTLSFAAVLSGCATAPPKQPDNICKIFEEKEDWYYDARDAQNKWGSPKHVLMAMMYQESSFRHDAAPPMEYFLGFIPIGRASSAYGYSQAKTPTWQDYIRETGNSGADRDDFEDAIDFMAWFVNKTHKVNGISKWDAYAQYLNYHEGWGGYKRGTYRKKKWLMAVANKVKHRAGRYGAQLKRCEAELDKSWFERLFS